MYTLCTPKKDESEEFEDALETNKGGEIDVFPIMSRCTLDIICGNY
jgi:hypothetical protein